MNTPKTIFNETDLTTTVNQIPSGISGVSLVTRGGPIGKPETLITTWEQFKRLYGGFFENDADANSAVLQAKRALEGGSALRVNRLVHYTDPSDPGSYDAEFSIQGQTNIFTLAGNLGAGHSISYTIGATQVTQNFDTTSINTLNLLKAKILAAFGNINDVRVMSGTVFIVIPEGANITTDVTATAGGGAPAVVRTTTTGFKDSAGNTIFSLAPKYPGEYYDNLKVYINDPSNGQSAAGYWDLVIEHLADSSQTETYRNILIPGSPTAANSHYLDDVIKKSKLVTVTYGDLSAIVGNPIIPLKYIIKFNAGTDGSAVADADMIGDSAGKTGFYAFDGVDDVDQIAILYFEQLSDAVNVAGAAYADTRKDVQYFMHLDGDTEAELIAQRDAIAVDTSYAMFFAGLIRVLDPSDNQEKDIVSMGDILGLAGASAVNYGLWYSFAGHNRGNIRNSLGATNQWGSAGNQANLDLLANRQINIVINRARKTMLWGCFTGQLLTSQLSLGGVRRLHMHMKKTLGPTLEAFLEEPNDFYTWKKIFLAVKPYLDTLITRRAIFDHRWEGDQFANSLNQLVINDANDVSLGKYKVRLFVKDIASLQEFSIDITLTPAGISFEDAINIVQP